MYKLRNTRKLATLRRSLGLLRSFHFEQTDPNRFYRGLARDTADLVAALWKDVHGTDLNSMSILDIGGGPGYFASEFARRGSYFVSVEPSVAELEAARLPQDRTVRGDGMQLPFLPNAFDITYSSNVAEHIPRPWDMAADMLRVTRPGGLVIVSYTVWLGPFGGHETGLWEHYVGGEFARERYIRHHGHPPKNVFGESLFELSCKDGLQWAERVTDLGTAELVGLFPRYHPSWGWWLVRVPIVREFLVSNLVIVLRKR